jgi:hypothetical protein
MDDIFSNLAARTDDVLSEAASLAADAGMPEATSGPILDGVRRRVGMLVRHLPAFKGFMDGH